VNPNVANATLTIDGYGQQVTNADSLIHVSGGGALIMNDGVSLTNNKSNSGGGVYVTGTNSKFTMNGGKIFGNGGGSTSDGGGVYVDGGEFEMNGGIIGGSNSERNTAGTGGGVYVAANGTFTMKGGEITNNTATIDGGGVYVAGAFTMGDNTSSPVAKITGNSAGTTSGGGNGGGVFFNSGNFTMNSGEISGNTGHYGGGVAVNSVLFTMNGGEISGNSATPHSGGDGGYGGGVYVFSGNFTMSDGEISGNGFVTVSSIVTNYGGGVYVDGTNSSFTISGGEISDNKANEAGGGVYINDEANLILTSGSITDNSVIAATADAYGGGVYVSHSGSGNDITFPTTGIFVISGNKAESGNGGDAYGGGIYIYSSATENKTYVFKNISITGNEVSGGVSSSGGGMGRAGPITITMQDTATFDNNKVNSVVVDYVNVDFTMDWTL
jgi:hypothetical protein